MSIGLRCSFFAWRTARIEEEIESQTRLAAERMALAVLHYFFRRPRMMTVCGVSDLADA
jgi:hypothetical protein